MKKGLKVAGHCMFQAVRHPRTAILLPNPGVLVSPIPWWGSLAVICIGIAAWTMGAKCAIGGLDEAGHALVYIPLSHIFGLASRTSKL